MKILSPQSSSAARQRLLQAYLAHHNRRPPATTAELLAWIDSPEGEAAIAEDKADATTAAKRQRQ